MTSSRDKLGRAVRSHGSWRLAAVRAIATRTEHLAPPPHPSDYLLAEITPDSRLWTWTVTRVTVGPGRPTRTTFAWGLADSPAAARKAADAAIDEARQNPPAPDQTQEALAG